MPIEPIISPRQQAVIPLTKLSPVRAPTISSADNEQNCHQIQMSWWWELHNRSRPIKWLRQNPPNKDDENAALRASAHMPERKAIHHSCLRTDVPDTHQYGRKCVRGCSWCQNTNHHSERIGWLQSEDERQHQCQTDAAHSWQNPDNQSQQGAKKRQDGLFQKVAKGGKRKAASFASS